MSWTGTLSFVDIGTGQWTLSTDDGKRVQLYGDIPATLDGKRVTVEGNTIAAHGFGMLGGKTGVEVESVREA